MTDVDRQFRGVIRKERPPDTSMPETRRPSRPWAWIAADLRADPGEWYLIEDDGGYNSASVTNRINNGSSSWWRPEGSCFALQRTIDGKVHVYAVYLGENHEYAEQAGVQSPLRRAA